MMLLCWCRRYRIHLADDELDRIARLRGSRCGLCQARLRSPLEHPDTPVSTEIARLPLDLKLDRGGLPPWAWHGVQS